MTLVMQNHLAPHRPSLLILAGKKTFLWLIRLLRLLSDAINPGLTTGRENYGCCLETLQRACIICLLLAHCEYKYTRSYCILAHSLHRHLHKVCTYTDMNRHTQSQKFTQSQKHTHVPPPESRGQTEDRVDAVFCKLLASAL